MLIADLRGFTSLSERLAPERVVALLDHYLTTMVSIIKQYQGTTDELIGEHSIYGLFETSLARPLSTWNESNSAEPDP
jgi:adenylate cyclase